MQPFAVCVTVSWSMTMSAFQFERAHYARFKLSVRLWQFAAQLKVTKRGKYMLSLLRDISLNIGAASPSVYCVVIISTMLNLNAPIVFNMVPVFECSSGPQCSKRCDLYMMKRTGSQFRHLVLSRESWQRTLLTATMHDRVLGNKQPGHIYKDSWSTPQHPHQLYCEGTNVIR